MNNTGTYTSKLSKPSEERVLTDRQQKFLDSLIITGGDPKRAAELAGYAEGSYTHLTKTLKNEIIDLASHILAQTAPKAAMKLTQIMDSDDPIPQANVRLQAAQTILDRIGLGKTEKIDVNQQMTGGIFILPSKEFIEREVYEDQDSLEDYVYEEEEE
jgi:phage terminase small subunit